MIKIILLVFLTVWNESGALETSKARTKLILSRLENNVNALRSEVDILKLDSNEIRMMIDEFNVTYYYENQCVISDMQQEENKRETQFTVANAGKEDGKIEILLQAFQDEKNFCREKLNEVSDSKNYLETLINVLETDSVALNERLSDDRRTFHTKIKDMEQKQEQRIESLEMDNVALKESINVEKRKSDSEIMELQEQLALNGKQHSNLADIFKLFKETEQKEKYSAMDKVKDLQGKVSELTEMQKHGNQCGGFWRINHELKSCILLVTKKRQWEEAAKFCEDLGSTLVEFQSREKLKRVQHLFLESGLDWGSGEYDGFWAGGSYIRNEGSWEWRANSLRFKWYNWYPLEPYGHYGANCLDVLFNDKDFRWDDQQCSRRLPFICEKSIS